MNRWIPWLLAALACPASAQQDYGYGGQSQSYEEPLAAPSTLPGQRSSSARVPQVRPAPHTPPPGQRQLPPAQGGIPWGSTASDGGLGNGSTSPYAGTYGGYSPYGGAIGTSDSDSAYGSGAGGAYSPGGDRGNSPYGGSTHPAGGTTGLPAAGAPSPYGKAASQAATVSP